MEKINQFNSLWLGSLILFLSISFNTFASVCGDLPKLTFEQCGHYDFIAYGRIDSEIDCEEGVALFTPVSIFKGDGAQTVNVYTSCLDGGLPLSKGSYWILFGDKNNAQEIHLNICGHSRQQIPVSETDYQTNIRGTSFQEDLSFLNKNFEPKVVGDRELLPKKYEKIDPVMVPLLIGIGLVFMIVGFFFIKRLK